MTDVTIPPEALDAAASAYTAVIYRGNGTVREFHEAITAAIRAGIAAWPGMWHIKAVDFEGKVILPIPTENTNAEV